MTGTRPRVLLCILCLALVLWHASAWAVPEISGLKAADVTTSSFSLVWMSDVTGDPEVQVFSDSAMTKEMTDKVSILPMPASIAIAEAARLKGNMKILVSGLSASTAYYVRAVMRDPQNPANIGYSPIISITTASRIQPYTLGGNGTKAVSNDLAAFETYIRPSSNELVPGLGDLVIMETDSSPYPISAFVGETVTAPEGLLDLNNLFGTDGMSLDISGGEKLIFTVYRGGMLSSLTHYRRIPENGRMVYVSGPVKGFFADINLDRNVNETDFERFREHYRTAADAEFFNPDFDFIEDTNNRVDARDFSRFSREYGRTDVE